jgi:D-alanyl-D-alanine carboxypeptidase/D-alanyl-D-alanine-endopeptidase (penicillin-binding protein 4)
MGDISRRFFLGGVAALTAGAARSEAPLTSPRPVPRLNTISRQAAGNIGDLIAQAQLSGKVGCVVANAQTGEVLGSHNPLLPLPPASVAKAVTAVYGLDALGAEHRFTTRLIASGPLANGRLDGDLVLAGGGDPELDTNALGDMARELKAAGLREVTGRFLVYAGALPYQKMIDPDQPDHLGYNPSVSGVNLNFNRVHFQWTKSGAGWAVSMDARTDRFRPDVTMARMRVVNRSSPVYTYDQEGDIDSWTVASGALGNNGSRWLPVRRPDLYAGEVFQTLARAHGIVLKPAESVARLPGGTVLVEHRSAQLADITRGMLLHSTNLTAEAIGLSASIARGESPRSLEASAKEMNRWMQRGLGAKRPQLTDHSGLSDDSRITARDMTEMLTRLGAGSALHGLMKVVEPLDAKGNGAPGYSIRAKTGTLNFVSSLAGYITLERGPPLAFAIFTGDIPARDAIAREDRERPDGARAWNRRSRWLQKMLIQRWAEIYSI